MKIKCLILTLAGLLLPLAGCMQQPDIARIYVSHGLDGVTGKEFRVDLTDGTFGSYYNIHMDIADARDPAAPDEGFTFVKGLDEKEMDHFLRAAGRHGFSNWAKDGQDYRDKEISPVRDWEIRIVYSDGTEDRLDGCNAYPDSWNDMNNAFKALTDEGVLEPGRISYR